MSVFAKTANRINLAFWGLLEAVGFAFKAIGVLALLAGFIWISEQTLNFMRNDYWQSKSLFWAIPDGPGRCLWTNCRFPDLDAAFGGGIV
jgi:hypothetical protein